MEDMNIWQRLKKTGQDIVSFGKPPQVDPAQATTPSTSSSTIIVVVLIAALVATIYFVTKKAN